LRSIDIGMLNIIAWLVLGGLVGRVASRVLRVDSQRVAVLNVAISSIGAMIGGFLFGVTAIRSGIFSLLALLVSFVGAIALLPAASMIAW